jgi:hypothetical protein
MAFQDLFINLEQWGFLDVVLPFILVFTIVFATLQKTKILGDAKKNFNVVIALVMAMTFIFPHVTGSYVGMIGFDPVDVVNQALPQVSIIMVAIIMVLLIIGVFGHEMNFAGKSLSGWIVILAFIAVAVIFGSATGWFRLPDWLYFLNDSNIQSLVIMILIFGLIIWFVTKDDSGNSGGGFNEWIKNNPGSIMVPRDAPKK